MADQHVYPVGDLREHETEGGECWCRPRVFWTSRQDRLVAHNSLDRREDYEGAVH